MGGDSTWQNSYEDPLRWKAAGAATESRSTGVPRVECVDSDNCSVKLVVMHRPTHDPARERSCEYPFSRHLNGRRRLWELRFQLRFREPPSGQLYFGLELEKFVPVSGLAKSAQKVLVGACRSVVGSDCYHSPGDDPSRVSGELELPTFVMPLWAFDQFVVSEPGQEPALDGDLDKVGFLRSNGVRDYIRNMQSTINSFSTDKVYTFCFWGISQFLDCIQWRVVGGLMPGVKMDFNKLCGSPPIHLSIYQMPHLGQQETDRRHLLSRKTYFFKVAVWSELAPPAKSAPEAAKSAESAEADLAAQAAALNDFSYWDDYSYDAGYFAPAPAEKVPAQPDSVDLLGMLASDAVQPAQAIGAGPGSKAESCDLLGLDF